MGGQPSTIGLLWLGTSTRTWNGAPVLPQPIAGALGCTLWTGLEAPTAALFDANGALQLPVPIPPVPALRRLTVFAQGAAVSPGSNALGFAFTDGLAIRIQ